MNLDPLFSSSDLDRWTSIFQKKANEKIYTLLQAAGEQFVKLAREQGNYKDQTGNLRSSIGYIIVSDGAILDSNFQKSGKGTEGDKGIENGNRIAKEVAKSYNNGMVLIGVAGMNYSVFVEAMEGLDVITGASIQTEQWMKKAIQSVFKKAGV